jgi:ribosomal protein S12 methylthiotransferase
VPTKTKKARYDRLMRTQQVISREKNRAWVGRSLSVLVDETRDGWSAGRSFRDAPEIDGWVFVQGDHTPGSFVECEVTEFGDYDLYGTAVGAAPSKRLMKPLRMAGVKAPQ